MKNHPALAEVDLPRTGKRSHATILVTKSWLLYGEEEEAIRSCMRSTNSLGKKWE